MASKKIKKAFWLSYDLGVGGDYENLYQWLDDHHAKPCGDNVAFFEYFYTGTGDIDVALERDLKRKIRLKPNNKLYLIRKDKKSDKVMGNFIYGKRSAAPWTGYGSLDKNLPDE